MAKKQTIFFCFSDTIAVSFFHVLVMIQKQQKKKKKKEKLLIQILKLIVLVSIWLLI